MVFNSALLVLAAGAILAGTAVAQTVPASDSSRWGLLAEGAKGESHRDPLCHPLQFFSGSPLPFDFDRDFSDVSRTDLSTRTLVKPVGTIAGRKIVQVLVDIRVKQDLGDEQSMMKLLLVQRQGKEFCAIYQQEYPTSQVVMKAAKIEKVEGEPVLVTRDENGQRDLNQEYWTFDAEGPIRLDLHVIDKALATILPPGHETRGDYGLNLQALCYQNPVWKREECDACASGGTVALKLGLQDHQLVVVRKQYDPAGRAGAEPDLAACTP
jgi:hypothetical protein